MLRAVGLALLLAPFLLAGCDHREGRKADDILLAEAGSRELWLSDVAHMVHESATPQDSALTIRAYVEHWVREQLLMAKAEENVPPDLDLDRLVEDYRSSLIRNNYERRLLETRLDSSVSEQELIAFYEENQEQYLLEKPIARFHFLKVRQDNPSMQEVDRWWNKADRTSMENLRAFSTRHAVASSLDDSLWLDLGAIAEMAWPAVSNPGSLAAGREVRYQDPDHRYWLRVLEVKASLEVAPLAYIREQATRAILHRRQVELIERTKEQLYQIAIRKNQVKIHAR